MLSLYREKKTSPGSARQRKMKMKMKKLIRFYTMDSGKISWITKKEYFDQKLILSGDAILVKSTKKNLAKAIWSELDYCEIMSYTELCKKSKQELIEIAANNDLII